MEDNNQEQGGGFYGLSIAPKLLATLDQLHFKTPTPIQRQAIPVACSGKDVAGIAQTGTGKTIAFGIPLIQGLAAKPGKGLVLVPTRELAQQVEEVLAKFAPVMGMKSTALIGGESMGRQLRTLRQGPRIIIATPGRLIDHLSQRNIRLDDVRILVLDEADRMLDMGFAPQIERILRAVPKERQTMLFSATLPEEIMKIAQSYMKLPVRVEVARSGTAAAKVVQEVFVVRKADKNALLQKVLDQYSGSVLLFSRTKHNAKKIARDLRNMGHTAAEIHSNRSQNQRREALEGFKSGKYRVLVATDIAARGIDVMGIELVVNYDLPDDYENYVHRIGRTGRAGQEGRAISFATPDQGADVRGIERILRASLPIVKHPDFPEERFAASEQQSHGRPHQHQRRGARRQERPAASPREQAGCHHQQGRGVNQPPRPDARHQGCKPEPCRNHGTNRPPGQPHQQQARRNGGHGGFRQGGQHGRRRHGGGQERRGFNSGYDSGEPRVFTNNSGYVPVDLGPLRPNSPQRHAPQGGKRHHFRKRR